MTKSWRVAPGEEARLTPEGPTAAEIVSRGFLPFRIRTKAGGVHHRPPFPGSTLLIGDSAFEVVAENSSPKGVVYLLEAWPKDHIIRDQIRYGPPLVEAVLAERRRIAERERSRRYAWLLQPFVGLLDEESQIRACDRLGLDPALTTMISGVFESLGVGLLFYLLVGPGAPSAGDLAAPFVAIPFGAYVCTAVLRAFGALVFGEIAGSALFTLAAGLGRGLWRQRERFDATLLPLTRTTFWARLSLPDRQQKQDDGTWVVRSTLPHLSWQEAPRFQVEGEWWMAMALSPTKQRGRLVHAYRLTPLAEESTEGSPPPRPPGPTDYQEEVLAGVEREWDDVLTAFRWLVSLLPSAVQRRALARRGGARAIRTATLVTASLTAASAAWFFAGPGMFNAATGVLFLGDGGFRLWHALRGEYAPSLVGGLIADYLRPERRAYHAHREAERKALDDIESAPSAADQD